MNTALADAQPPLPRMFTVRQEFPASSPCNVAEAVQNEIDKITAAIQPGTRIGIGVGSRGITNIKTIVQITVQGLQAKGAKPFIIPAMGSHGGASAIAQTELLAEYGITEESMDVPIKATMEVQTVGKTLEGSEVVWALPAVEADAVMVINRIKPHTDFSGKIGSGLIKMAVVGLGKRVGASNFHRAASRNGYETSLRERFKVLTQTTPFIGGLGLIEDQFHQTAHIEWVSSADAESREEVLFKKASAHMPRIPYETIDLLIVDRIGKNISGAGMDPNIIGRSVHGYLTSPQVNPPKPYIRRIFVRDLTPETHGNAIGIGLADITTRRLVEATNHEITFLNALTALSTNGAKIPIYFDTDKEAIHRVPDTLALDQAEHARIVRIQDTLNLAKIQASEPFFEETKNRTDLTVESPLTPLSFNGDERLLPFD